MEFYPNQIFHLYNQGNNQQPVFFNEGNYLYFLRKMRRYILPYADVLAYCLMPNHFHWLIYTKPTACEMSKALKSPKRYKESPAILASKEATLTKKDVRQQSLNHAIGTLLSSYSKGVNKQQGFSGSLFRAKTKAKDGVIDGIITIDGKNKDLFFKPENNYARICFNYIHNNPPEAGLAATPTDWVYSSAKDYAGLRKGTLCNQPLAKKLGLL